MKKIILEKVLFFEERRARNGNQYIRVRFLTNDEKKASVSITYAQALELRDKMKIKFKNGEEIESNQPLELVWTKGELTNKGKDFVEIVKGNFNDIEFEYYNLSPALFIRNNVIKPTDFRREIPKFLL